MANPTNISVPPAKAADPTNIGVPVHGTKFEGGVTGADFVWSLHQGNAALGAGVTNSVANKFVAPFDAYIRQIVVFGGEVGTGTHTADVYNNTTTTALFSAVTITDASVSTVTSVTAPNVTAGDRLDFRITTPATTGAADGAGVFIYGTQIAGSATNPV